MTYCFVDTSAIFAAIWDDDPFHHQARSWLDRPAQERGTLITHSWAAVETVALTHSRGGSTAAHRVAEWITDKLVVHDVDAQLRLPSIRRFGTAPARISLIDCTSFVFMETIGCTRAFAFDRHFADAGFELVPGM